MRSTRPRPDRRPPRDTGRTAGAASRRRPSAAGDGRGRAVARPRSASRLRHWAPGSRHVLPLPGLAIEPERGSRHVALQRDERAPRIDDRDLPAPLADVGQALAIDQIAPGIATIRRLEDDRVQIASLEGAAWSSPL